MLSQKTDLRPIMCLEFARQTIRKGLEYVGVYFEILNFVELELVFAFHPMFTLKLTFDLYRKLGLK
jgi:hypothetical protein